MVGVLGVVTNWVGWGDGQGYVRFEDWTVDGIPLRDLIAELYDPVFEPPTSEITGLVEPSEEAVAYLDVLLGERPATWKDGRVDLFLCPIDLDPDCGCATAALVMDEDSVQWRDLGWDGDWGDDDPKTYAPPVTLIFARSQYLTLLRDLRRRYTPSL